LLVTFTSADPHYRSTAVLTRYTLLKATPAFSLLYSPAIAVGEAKASLSGSIRAVGSGIVPSGDYVILTVDGVSVTTTVFPNGTFSATFPSSFLPVGKLAVTYSFTGDTSFNAAHDGTSILNVEPLAVPRITLNPMSQTVTAGDPVTFTAAAVGSPGITVQWQVSTDGGATFTNITGNLSAESTTLSFYVYATENGYEYRAVFTNSAGTTATSAATLTVESDGTSRAVLVPIAAPAETSRWHSWLPSRNQG
jgi:hypothetical protein